MAKATVTSLGIVASAQAKASGTTLSMVANQTIPANTMLVLAIVYDNHASASASVCTFSNTPTGQLWANRLTASGQGVTTTAGTGIWIRWVTVLTNGQINSGATITTITWSVAVVARAAVMIGLSGSNESPISGSTATAQGSTVGTPTTTTNSTPASGDLVIGVIGSENTSVTADSDTTNGTWSTIYTMATSGSTADTNVCVGIQYKQITATASQTFNATGAIDCRISVQTFQTDIIPVASYGCGIPI